VRRYGDVLILFSGYYRRVNEKLVGSLAVAGSRFLCAIKPFDTNRNRAVA
jgi:hypothetical protein